MSLLEAALAYARKGWLVLPLNGKLPRTAHAYKDATTDSAVIRRWWNEWPTAGIGIAVGPESNLSVLDVDPRNGGADGLAAWIERHGDLPEAPRARTGGGGWHYYFEYSPEARRCDFGNGCELKANGGYVVAPPSTGYHWEQSDTFRPPAIPGWLIQSSARSPRAAPKPGEKIAPGGRNNHLTSVAGAMRRRGASTVAIRAALDTENESAFSEPLPSHEIDSIMRSAGAWPEPAGNLAEVRSDLEYSDAGNAERLVIAGRGLLRHSPAYGWLAWTGGPAWKRDAEHDARNLLIRTMRGLYFKAGGDPPDKPLAAHALRSLGEPRLRGAMTIAEGLPGVPIDPEALDASPFRLACANGTLDLNTGDFRASHRHEDYITRHCPVEFDWGATAPRWLAFIGEITGGDTGLAGFLQQAVGYSLTGSTDAQKLFMLYGTGANGKSTFLETISAMLGDYARAAPFDTFLAGKYKQADNVLASLAGARLVRSVEAGAGRHLDEGLVKWITGGETISARQLYREFFQYRPAFKLWFAANHKPTIRGQDDGMWRRIWLVPFTVSIPPERQDHELSAKLREELPGILRWAFMGYASLRQAGWLVPECVTGATGEYRDEMDTFGEFLQECCVTDDSLSEASAVIFKRYLSWLESRGEKATPSTTWLGLKLAERNFKRCKVMGKRGWKGLEVRP